MGTFLLVLFIVVLLIAGMSIGVIFGRKPISGTCGGIGALGISTSCEICGGNTQKCEESRTGSDEAVNPENLAYDATKSEK
ncbi:(Na+)-NQR maturation NqrM [Marinobacter daepoensis]|uniref:(Na+)-NQR maturation NqrM n=1 Tax=Marinobacter daepoensis TaxID=262077 RepID=A0ABS3BCI3_9GAMM|nr:(Na+)-NQR maturation NqrM [Marinobacter daepoensis]MBN7769548.1 (Na+)-NQR maturation NqrM [Marinobacter daepoensis]MBY6031791.1 (Na+)-NQR maturation NqrM [Marinobacter daepoensis]MBY6078238.1 (Na+)-NQR maturation NqrM [Marinobacter daepoensis]